VRLRSSSSERFSGCCSEAIRSAAVGVGGGVPAGGIGGMHR